MKKLLSLTLIFILSAGFLTSCKKDKGEPPVLPPQESMIIDFSNFTSGKKSALLYEQKGDNNSNWEFASTAPRFWNSLITTTLIVPATSYKLAADYDPVYLDVKTWQWSYNFSVANVPYKARLIGEISTTDVLWKMYITKDNPDGFAEFVWFEGTSNLDGTGGQWIFNESAQSQVPILQIDWTKTVNPISTVKYTYLKNNSFKNSYIDYGLTSATLNASYNIHYYDGIKFSDVNVEWNTTTKNGRVKCSDYLLGEWYPWDANYVNI